MSATPPISREDKPDEARLTVLQLDTVFPRIKGDVASHETYLEPIKVEKIPQASVAKVVTATPDQNDMTSFLASASAINSGIGVTSCGFLGYWQDQLNRHCPRPFIASALVDLPQWQQQYAPDEMAIITFDEKVLSTPLYAPLLAGFSGQVIGLHPEMHLKKVISDDHPQLDQQRAETELIAHLKASLDFSAIKALVFECTNLPPYRRAMKSALNVDIYDILTSINARDPKLVRPELLA